MPSRPVISRSARKRSRTTSARPYLREHGKKRWTKAVFEMVALLAAATAAGRRLVLGGAASRSSTSRRQAAALRRDENAFPGGFRLWDPAGASTARARRSESRLFRSARGDAVRQVRHSAPLGHRDLLEVGGDVSIEEPNAGAEEDRHEIEPDLVDEARGESLAGDGRPAGDSDVAAGRRLLRLRDRGLDAVGDERERRPALALERWARVMGDDEDRKVERRILAPPTVPRIVVPTGLGRRRTCSVPSRRRRDSSLHPGEPPCSGNRCRPPLRATRARRRALDPVVEAHAADTDRVIDALIDSAVKPSSEIDVVYLTTAAAGLPARTAAAAARVQRASGALSPSRLPRTSRDGRACSRRG